MASTDPHPPSTDLAFLDAHELTQRFGAGTLTSVELVTALLDRIAALDRSGPELHAVISLEPDALGQAAALDAERAAGRTRGPLHGIPVLVKDNIDTVGPLGTTAGSLALADTGPSADAPLVTSLRAAGALVLGKTNLSEWASIRSDHSTSGWSAVGGLCRNPHALDRSAGGSSSGSGAAVAAGYAPLAVGTETDGSIVCPSALNGLVGLKPTVGSITGAGIVPISHRQDTAGPMARSVRDAALMFSVLSGQPAVELDSVRGRRLGVPRTPLWGHHPASDAAATVALEALDAAGVVIVDDLELPALPDDKSIGRILLADLVVDLRCVPGHASRCSGGVPVGRDQVQPRARGRRTRALRSGSLHPRRGVGRRGRRRPALPRGARPMCDGCEDRGHRPAPGRSPARRPGRACLPARLEDRPRRR